MNASRLAGALAWTLFGAVKSMLVAVVKEGNAAASPGVEFMPDMA